MSQRRLDHVGIFVTSLEEASKIYERFDLHISDVKSFRRSNGREVQVGVIHLEPGLKLELIEDPEALAAGTQPLNHICFEVSDLPTELEALREAGVPLEDAKPRPGVLSSAIAFLDSSAAGGVRIELAQHD